MSKRKSKREIAERYQQLLAIAQQAHPDLRSELPLNPSDDLRKMKKFRFQLLQQWITTYIAPCRVADIGGGKGLLAYLLQQRGWQVQVIDPHCQPLPSKYKDLTTGKQILIPSEASVPRRDVVFESHLASNFDLLVGMHAHGCNIKIIDAAMKQRCRYILLPCCIIDEPLLPPPEMHWLECVLRYALDCGSKVIPFQLNFRGQNIGFYGLPK